METPRKRLIQPTVAFSGSFEESDRKDREFWRSRTSQERLWHLEFLRELNYGPETSTHRLPRVPRVSQRKWG